MKLSVKIFRGIITFLLNVLCNQIAAQDSFILSSQAPLSYANLFEKYQTYNNIKNDSALYYALQMKEIAQKNDNTTQKIETYVILCELYEILGKSEHTIQYGLAGLEELDKQPNNKTKVLLYIFMSNAYSHQSLASEAAVYGLKALTLAEEIKDAQIIGRAAENMGNIYYFLLKDYQTSLKYYKITADYYLQYEYKGAAGILSHLGNNYYQKQDYKEALNFYQKAFKIAESNKDVYAMGYTTDNMGLVYFKKNELQQAAKYFKQGLAYRQSVGNVFEIINSLNHVAKCEIGLGNITEALSYATENLQLSRKTQNYDLIIEALETMATVKEKEKKIDEALLLQKEINRTKDSLFRQQNELKVKQIAITHNLMQKDKENEMLTQSNLYQEKSLKTQNKTIWIIGIAAILVSLLLVIVGIAKMKQSKTTKELEQKNKEIEQKNDLIEQKRQLLLEQNIELSQLNQSQNQLFSIIGHDLRSPIASLSGLLGITLSKDISQEEFLMLAQNLKHHTESIHNLLENLLAWSQLQQKGNNLQPINLDLLPLFQLTIRLYNEQAHKKNISLITETTEDLAVYADENHVKFVLRNLVGNALKFTQQEGKIFLKAEKEQNYAHISITDTGIGMNELQLQTLFNSKQHSFTTIGTQGEKGNGLGLVFCKDFIEKNKGTITVESEEKKGTTFHIRLPVAHSEI